MTSILPITHIDALLFQLPLIHSLPFFPYCLIQYFIFLILCLFLFSLHSPGLVSYLLWSVYSFCFSLSYMQKYYRICYDDTNLDFNFFLKYNYYARLILTHDRCSDNIFIFVKEFWHAFYFSLYYLVNKHLNLIIINKECNRLSDGLRPQS